MENTLFCIFKGHHKVFSEFCFIFFISPQRSFMVISLLFSHKFTLINSICIWISIKSFIIEIFGIIFCGNPCVTFCFLIFFKCQWIYILLNSEKLILQKFRALFLSFNSMEMLFYKLLIFFLFHYSFKDIIHKLS
jgi:hypothetical protein